MPAPDRDNTAVRPSFVLLFLMVFYLCFASIPPLRAISILLEAGDMSDAVYRAYGRFRNTNDVPWRDGWGVSYRGAAGLVLAIGQMVWILASGTLIGVARGRWMWIGMLGLLAWTIFWTANAVYMQAIVLSDTPEGIPHVFGLVLMTVIVVTTWRRGRKL
ncbi:MAG: hypothetical protein ACIAQF_11885 [Phycisphaerales bacterium JB065]